MKVPAKRSCFGNVFFRIGRKFGVGQPHEEGIDIDRVGVEIYTQNEGRNAAIDESSARSESLN